MGNILHVDDSELTGLANELADAEIRYETAQEDLSDAQDEYDDAKRNYEIIKARYEEAKLQTNK